MRKIFSSPIIQLGFNLGVEPPVKEREKLAIVVMALG